MLPKSNIVLPTLEWRESPNKSNRHSEITLIVVHDTEGGYRGAVDWLCNPASQVSAHIVLREDGQEATQLVPYHAKAWHCAAYNSQSIGLELAGFAGRGYPDIQLRKAARIVAFLCDSFSLPARYVGTNPGKAGFTFHQDLGIAGGNHHDPGLHGLRKWQFIALVKYEARRGHFRAQWGR